MADDISYFGETTFRRRFQRFGIKQADRLLHTYLLGSTGAGKSSLIELLARGDVEANRGFALLDPHGDLAERLIASASPADHERIVYLNATDLAQPYGYNPLRRVREDRIPLAASGLLETLRKLWPLAWGVRMEHVLRNSLFALLERDGSTLPHILRLYSDDTFRREVVRGIRNQVVKRFWTAEFEKYPWPKRMEAVAPIQNKLGALLADPRLYRILVKPQVDLSFRSIMDEGRVLIVNLSKGQIGEDAMLLLGSLLVSTIGLAAYSRAELVPEHRRPFVLYADEFQNFATLSFVNMVAELRKGGCGLVLANQHLHQLEPDIRHSVLANAGTLIAFRVGAEDAPMLARELQPAFGVEDLINLPNRHFYTRLMIEAAPSRAFSARSLAIPGG